MKPIDEEIKSKFANNKVRMMVNLMYTTNCIKNHFTDFLKPYEISSQQFNILRILRGDGDWLAMSIVKDRMIEKSPNATRLADKMIAKDLIERKRCDNDRRVVYVKITKEGLKLLKEIDEVNNEDRINYIENVTEEEAKIVSDLLDKLRG